MIIAYVQKCGATFLENERVAVEKGEDKLEGLIMYDVNGKRGPNVWGKDVFGFNVYANKIEPFGKNEDPITLESDCSRQGTGVFCSFALLQDIQEP